jgi:hypothetical protein
MQINLKTDALGAPWILGCRLAVSATNPNDLRSVGVHNPDSPQPTSYELKSTYEASANSALMYVAFIAVVVMIIFLSFYLQRLLS